MSTFISNTEFKKAFVQNKLVIDCVKITLTQNDSKTPKIWVSAGCLEIDILEGIKARLICNTALEEKERFEEFFIKNNDVVSGQLYPKNKYYSLHAEDVNGQIWVNPEVSIKLDYYESGTVITIDCDWIQSTEIVEEKENEKDSIYMLFLEKLPFPLNSGPIVTTELNGKSWTNFNTNLSKGKVLEFDITYQPSEDNLYHELYINNSATGEIPIYLENRFIEAIRFTTAQKTSYSICEKVHSSVRTIEIRKSIKQLENKGLLQTPYPSTSPTYDGFYHLFECYLKYAVSEKSGEDFSYISNILATMQQLYNVPLESIALILSVGIEGIVNNEFKELLIERDTSILGDIKLVTQNLITLELKDESMNRVAGLLNSVKGTRAVDKLMKMANEGVFSNENVTAWKKLRDATAHSGLHVSPEYVQKLLDNLYSSMMLMYKLIYLRISYDGKYHDYSKIGWPILEFKASEFNSKIKA